MTDLEVLLGLLVVVAALATAARRVHVPPPILMLVGGVALGFVPGLPKVALDPQVVFLVFLPPLLYVAAVFAPVRGYRVNAPTVGLLGVGLVIVTAAAVAAAARALIPSLGWAQAFALGAIVAPPDAVAATSILQRVGVPRRVIAILEGESLLNDATALVAYRLALVAAVSGSFSAPDAVASFLLIGVGGVARRLRDTPVSITVSILTPFAAYLAAERLALSGVLATVTAGLYIGRRLSLLSSEDRITGGAVWQTITFLLNGLLFTLLGMQLPEIIGNLGGRQLGEGIAITAALALVAILVRFGWIFAAIYAPKRIRGARRGDPPASPRAIVVVGWAGMRGAVSLAAALALPLQFPERDLVIFITFGVILVTLVGQPLTLPFLARGLRLVAAQDPHHQHAHPPPH